MSSNCLFCLSNSPEGQIYSVYKDIKKRVKQKVFASLRQEVCWIFVLSCVQSFQSPYHNITNIIRLKVCCSIGCNSFDIMGFRFESCVKEQSRVSAAGDDWIPPWADSCQSGKYILVCKEDNVVFYSALSAAFIVKLWVLFFLSRHVLLPDWLEYWTFNHSWKTFSDHFLDSLSQTSLFTLRIFCRITAKYWPFPKTGYKW